jgi:uncharacterized protein YqeY
MSLQDQLTSDMKIAMKAQDKTKLSVIRMVLSAIKYAELEKKAPLTYEQLLDVLARELKQRKDSHAEFTKGNREDLVAKVEAEIAIIEEYLPEQLSEDEVRAVVTAAVAEVGATSKADMGRAMGRVMPELKGRADGKLINKIVQELLL